MLNIPSFHYAAVALLQCLPIPVSGFTVFMADSLPMDRGRADLYESSQTYYRACKERGILPFSCMSLRYEERDGLRTLMPDAADSLVADNARGRNATQYLEGGRIHRVTVHLSDICSDDLSTFVHPISGDIHALVRAGYSLDGGELAILNRPARPSGPRCVATLCGDKGERLHLRAPAGVERHVQRIQEAWCELHLEQGAQFVVHQPVTRR